MLLFQVANLIAPNLSSQLKKRNHKPEGQSGAQQSQGSPINSNLIPRTRAVCTEALWLLRGASVKVAAQGTLAANGGRLSHCCDLDGYLWGQECGCVLGTRG